MRFILAIIVSIGKKYWRQVESLVKVIFVTGSLGDGAGGLASAVRGWAEALATAGNEVTLFCLELTDTFGPNRLPAHPSIKTVEVPCLIERRTRLILAPILEKMLRCHCVNSGADIIHAHGVWLPGTRIAARVARQYDIPLVVSPHGHLQPWAMAHKSWKKSLAWGAYGKRSLNLASVVQAASSDEAFEIRTLGVKSPVAVIPNVVDLPHSGVLVGRGGGDLRVALFLSRIHPSKGLLNLVHAWSTVRPLGWQLIVAGSDEINHLSQVKEAVRESGLSESIRFVGAVPYESRWEWYSRADLFILPTYSENFGLTVAEALGAGVPVITTKAAPWRALEEWDCGWWIDTGTESLAAALQVATKLEGDVRRDMGLRGRRFVMEHYSPTPVAENLQAVYGWVRRESERPAGVEVIA